MPLLIYTIENGNEESKDNSSYLLKNPFWNETIGRYVLLNN